MMMIVDYLTSYWIFVALVIALGAIVFVLPQDLPRVRSIISRKKRPPSNLRASDGTSWE